MPQNQPSNSALRTYNSFHRKQLEKAMGLHSQLAQFLWPHSLSANRLFDDFNGEVIDLNLWSVPTGGAGGTIFAQRVADVEGTMIRGSTGTTDNTTVAIHSAANWFGDRNCMLETRFKLDVVTSLVLEVGFTDPLTDEGLTILSDIDTPTIANGATDVAIVCMDTDQTLITMAFVTEGSTASMVPTKTDLGTRVPVAATWMTIRVGIIDNAAFCQVFDSDDPQNLVLLEEAYHGDAVASQTEGGVAMEPHILIGTRNTTAKVMDIDYILLVQDR